MPIQITGIPSAAVVTEAELIRSGPADPAPWIADIELSLGGNQIDIEVAPANPVPNVLSPPNATVVCKTEIGLTGCVSIPTQLPSLADGATALLSRLTLLGTDEAHWTTHVIN